MSHDRREFLGRLAVGAVGASALGIVGFPAGLAASPAVAPTSPTGAAWDTSWAARLTGRVRTVFDVPEVESGFGVWRASIWAAQYRQVLGMAESDLSTALVLRHNAIVLAMQQAAWDRYGLAELSKASHPLTDEPTRPNPALIGAEDGLGQPHASFALPEFLKRGGVALACDLALAVIAAHMAKVDRVSDAVAKERAVAALVPGVTLQPSGVFAVLYAQQAAGAVYIRAS